MPELPLVLEEHHAIALGEVALTMLDAPVAVGRTLST
jgi:hypothetical protein